VTASKPAVAVAAVAATAILLTGVGATAEAGSVSADVTIAPLRADDGASIDVSRIAVADALSPGGRYRLPAFGIRNPGGRRVTFRLGVAHLVGQARKPAPADWFRFAPGTLVLGAGRTRAVSASLELPRDADPGDYAALVSAWLVPDGVRGGAGAGAGAHVTFGVASPGRWEAWWRRLDLLWISFALASLLVLWRVGRHVM
jgi:hypothetical protein